jgi:hypothetical protein
MFDQDSINELNEEPPRSPILWPDWRLQFELDLRRPLLDERLALTPWEPLLKNDETRRVLISINYATPFCYDFDRVMSHRFQGITSTF